MTAAPGPQPDEVRELVDALAGVVASANTGMVNGDDGFVESYNVMPGPIHRAIPLLARHGVVADVDGQIRRSPAAPSAQPDEVPEFPCGWCGETDEHGTHCPSWTTAQPNEVCTCPANGPMDGGCEVHNPYTPAQPVRDTEESSS